MRAQQSSNAKNMVCKNTRKRLNELINLDAKHIRSNYPASAARRQDEHSKNLTPTHRYEKNQTQDLVHGVPVCTHDTCTVKGVGIRW